MTSMPALQSRETIAAQPTPETGFMAVLSAPSGGGKTTILRCLLAGGDPAFQYSVSATTRPPRNGEVNGCDYHFLTLEEFHRRAQAGEFIEYAHVHGNFYGTPRASVEKWIALGKIVLLDLDVQGGLNVKRQMEERALLIFIRPPSLEALRERLEMRNTDRPEDIAARLETARQELEQAEYYDHVVVNLDLESTVQQVRKIINQYRQQTRSHADWT
jgi:guanylate kinase